MLKILVTGVNGFVGQHLADAIHAHGDSVIGVGREEFVNPAIRDAVEDYVVCDLADSASIESLKPHLLTANAIINLAGIATTNNDPDRVEAVMSINAAVHELLYQSLCEEKSQARIIAVSTGLVYEPDQAMPLTESSLLLQDSDQTNAYVRSKLRVENIAGDYRKKGLDLITARPFNHTGPGQGLGFFVPDQIAKIRRAIEGDTRMDLGDSFDFWRDFTDVRDVVEAYYLLATLPQERLLAATYNISSGVPVFGRDLFRMIAAGLNFTNFEMTNSTESSSTKIYGSHSLLTKDTGWQPKIELKNTITDQV